MTKLHTWTRRAVGGPLASAALFGLTLALSSCGDAEPAGSQDSQTQVAALGGAGAGNGDDSVSEDPASKPARAEPAAATGDGPGHDDGHGHDHDDGDHPGEAEDGSGHDADGDGLPAAKADALGGADDLAGGVLAVDGRDHNFGNVLQGEVLEHTWNMSNEGEGELKISRAKPTCGCTVSHVMIQDEEGAWVEYVYDSPIVPGTQLKLAAKLDTRNKSSKAKSKINVFSNDPRGVIALGLEATVGTYFQVTPDAINLGNLSIEDTGTGMVTVTGRSGDPFLLSLKNIKTPDGMTVDLKPHQPDEEGRASRWNVEVTVAEGKRPGRIGFPIQLASDEQIDGAKALPDGTPPTYSTTVMVSGNVADLISFKPNYLSFGLVRPGQVLSRSVRIEVNDDDFQLGEPEITLRGAKEGSEFVWAEHFSTTIKPIEGGKKMDVELTLDGLPDDADGSFQGLMVLEVGHPSTPEFRVAFSGVVRGGVR